MRTQQAASPAMGKVSALGPFQPSVIPKAQLKFVKGGNGGTSDPPPPEDGDSTPGQEELNNL